MEITKIHARYPEKKGFSLHRYTEDEVIFIHFLTPATLVLKGHQNEIQEGACVFFSRQSDYILSAPETDLIHDWFHASGETEELIRQYGLETETVYYPAGHEFVTELVSSIEAERKMKSPFYDRLCSLLGEQLIAKLARVCSVPDTADVAPDLYGALCEVRKRLHTSFADVWTVEKMAGEVNLSASYFHTLYKKIFGISPKQDLVKIRLQHAKSLLRHSNLNIAEIAEQSGLGSSFHLIRSFKGAFGITPNQYRLSQKR